eukprot:SAG31_NODE_31429_length_368_cov_0.914498_1_plen_95_part_10
MTVSQDIDARIISARDSAQSAADHMNVLAQLLNVSGAAALPAVQSPKTSQSWVPDQVRLPTLDTLLRSFEKPAGLQDVLLRKAVAKYALLREESS